VGGRRNAAAIEDGTPLKSFGMRVLVVRRHSSMRPARQQRLVGSMRGWLWPLWPNAGDQRLATLDFPLRPILSRVRCIALFCGRSLLGLSEHMGRTFNAHDLVTVDSDIEYHLAVFVYPHFRCQ